MKENLDKYWGDSKKMNHLLYIVLVLDLKHKLDFMEYSFQEIQPGEKGVVLLMNNVICACFI